ncbi:MAG: hypothetical protein IT406_03415 [Candidatus Yanofskybacteria bacterium]|nr:hypothetical protein [Candidatus Yanofskybacteria bacterium]
MKLSARKNRKLIQQYPFVHDILGSRSLEPLGGERVGGQIDDLTIRVQKADGDLMFRRAHNIGLAGDNGHIFSLKGPRNGQVGRCGEYIFAIDASGGILNRVAWPRNQNERRGKSNLYAWSVLWAGRTTLANGELGYTKPICDKVAYLVWVTVEAWHKMTGVAAAPFGEFVDRLVEVTIYGAPDCGFEKLQEKSNVYENLHLDSNTLMNAMLDNDFDIISINGQLSELCQSFQDDVYFSGMKEVLDKGNVRGASGQLGPVKVLVGEMCGYDRVQLEDGSCWVSFQLRPGAKNMYVLGVGGTLPQIRRLIKTAVKAWSEKPEVRAAFKADREVSVL